MYSHRDGNEVVQKQPPIPLNEYQMSLETGAPAPSLTSSSVRYWSDFNRVYYHPRSVVQLNEYELNSTLAPFENWAVGEELFRDIDREHDLLDRDVRPFAEECDQLRALQIFTGADDAWGGFAARYVDSLKDEYSKTGIWVWAVEGGERLPRVSQILLSALQHSDLRVLTFPAAQEGVEDGQRCKNPEFDCPFVNIVLSSDRFTDSLSETHQY